MTEKTTEENHSHASKDTTPQEDGLGVWAYSHAHNKYFYIDPESSKDLEEHYLVRNFGLWYDPLTDMLCQKIRNDPNTIRVLSRDGASRIFDRKATLETPCHLLAKMDWAARHYFEAHQVD